jgi:membrane protein DedA with SNARE-associated domain
MLINVGGGSGIVALLLVFIGMNVGNEITYIVGDRRGHPWIRVRIRGT